MNEIKKKAKRDSKRKMRETKEAKPKGELKV